MSLAIKLSLIKSLCFTLNIVHDIIKIINCEVKMKARTTRLGQSLHIITDDESYLIIRNLAVKFYYDNLLPIDPLVNEITHASGRPKLVESSDQLPHRVGNKIVFHLEETNWDVYDCWQAFMDVLKQACPNLIII